MTMRRTARYGSRRPAHAAAWPYLPVVMVSLQRGAVAAALLAVAAVSVGVTTDPGGASTGGRGIASATGAEAIDPPSQTGTRDDLSSAESPPLAPHPPNTSVGQPGAGPTGGGPSTVPGSSPGVAVDGIPSIALAAYRNAERREASLAPGCGISWSLVAAIGRVESDHGRFAGSVLLPSGLSTPRIIGIQLNGNGTEVIRDTDHGRLDGDTGYDRAVGPLQFIPSTWALYSVDASGDKLADPFNIYDAAAAAADYLCAAGGDLHPRSGQITAVLAYNHSSEYLATVLGLADAYAAGQTAGIVAPVDVPAQPPIVTTLPPVDPGPPAAAPPPVSPASTTAASRSPQPSESSASASPRASATSPRASATSPSPSLSAGSGAPSSSTSPSGGACSPPPPSPPPSPSPPSPPSPSPPSSLPSLSATPTPTSTMPTSAAPSPSTSTTDTATSSTSTLLSPTGIVQAPDPNPCRPETRAPSPSVFTTSNTMTDTPGPSSSPGMSQPG